MFQKALVMRLFHFLKARLDAVSSLDNYRVISLSPRSCAYLVISLLDML